MYVIQNVQTGAFVAIEPVYADDPLYTRELDKVRRFREFADAAKEKQDNERIIPLSRLTETV